MLHILIIRCWDVMWSLGKRLWQSAGCVRKLTTYLYILASSSISLASCREQIPTKSPTLRGACRQKSCSYPQIVSRQSRSACSCQLYLHLLTTSDRECKMTKLARWSRDLYRQSITLLMNSDHRSYYVTLYALVLHLLRHRIPSRRIVERFAK